MTRRAQSGITLLEVLVAVTLLSLLSAGMMTSMRLGLGAMGRTNDTLMANRRVAGAQRILEQHLEGFMPVVAECRPGPDAPPLKMPFFQGEPQSMRFVSSYSLEEAARGYPRIVELQVIPGEEGKGVRLVLNEHLYSGPISAGFFCLGRVPDPLLGVEVPRFRPIEAGPRSFVLADKLAYCRFVYQEVLPPPVLTEWRTHWILPKWPRGIRIEMAPLEDHPSRVRPLTVTAHVRVNRYPVFDYGDF